MHEIALALEAFGEFLEPVGGFAGATCRNTTAPPCRSAPAR